MHRVLALTFLLATSAVAADPAPPTLSETERVAAFKAAGFKLVGKNQVRCEEDPPTASYTPGTLQVMDLNKDGRAEAWITESSAFCYGSPHILFVLLTREPSGSWTKLIDVEGDASATDTLHGGWPDIELGGPGSGPFPRYRWNGKGYALVK
jgi:hypothetical protein